MKKTNRLFAAVLVCGCVGPLGSALADGEDECFPGGNVMTQTLFLSTDEATGPKYRKIGLNGFPLPDEKPQQKEETDAEPEETFINAFNHTLSHQVTDIYVPLEGTELALAVRRNWTPEIWNYPASGLRPSHNRPDRPFGEGWRSNIGANIMFAYPYDQSTALLKDPPYAYVTDENGASYRFLILPFTLDGVKFFPMPEHRHQQDVLATKLEKVEVEDGPDYYVFTKKFGMTLTFEDAGTTIVAENARNPTSAPSGVVYTWRRLAKVEDRFGTEVNFSFSGTADLLPSSITSRSKTINISYMDGKVSGVTDPLGNVTSYAYEDKVIAVSEYQSQTAKTLVSVTREDETQTDYAYDGAWENDWQPRAWDDPARYNRYFYLDLASITDPNGKTTGLTYGFDHTRSAFMIQEFYRGWYQPSGSPRNVTSVAMPEGVTAGFENKSNVYIGHGEEDPYGPLEMQGAHQMKVTDGRGGVWEYDFTNAEIVRMDEFQDLVMFDWDVMNQSVRLMILYQKMTVSTPEGGEMVAEFDVAAGMALKSFKDVGSEQATTFEYDDDFDFQFVHPWPNFPSAALAQIPTTKWGDPTKQINGELKEKEFTYDAQWRVMDSVIDEEGRQTIYEINAGNGNRIKETVKTPANATVQETLFSYENTNFPATLTKKVVTSGTSDPGWATNLETRYVLSATTGNVATEFVGSGTNRKTEYTYDANNNKLTTTDPNGNTTNFTYDELNRLTAVNPPGTGTKVIAYDSRGNKIRETDENGNSTLRIYDGLNRVTKEARDMNDSGDIDSPDLVTENTYNGLNAKTSVKSPNGWTTTMEYDGLNRLVKVIDPYARETNLEYGANSGGLQFGKDFQPTKVTDARGFQTVSIYDANYRPTEKKIQYAGSGTSALFATTKWEYDDVGNVVKETDPLNRDTEKTYDALNRETYTKWADLSGIETFYTRSGLKWKTVDESFKDTLVEYDDAGRPTKVSSPLVPNGVSTARAVTESVYDPAGNVIETINPLNYSWTFEYDNRNRKVKETRPGSGSPTLEWEYDAVGNVVKTIDARDAETVTAYDAANRSIEITEPAVAVLGSGTMQPVTEKEYDKNGNLTKLTDANEHETVNTYDKLNQLLTTTDAESIVVENEYDEVGNRTAVIDGKNQQTDFVYDGLKRNTGITDAGGKSTTFLFDAVNKTARIDAIGNRTDYTYDVRNRLTQVSYKDPSGNPVNTATNATRGYDYDATGNLLAVTETAKSGKADVAYSYDALKRQLTETSGGLTHYYDYDLAGNRVSCLYGGLSVPLVSTYDVQNRLATLTQGTLVTAYAYDLNGNILTKTLPNGDTATSVYDSLNRSTSLVGTSGTSTTLYSYVYDYDAVGSVKKVTETYANTALNRVVTNAYDDIYRLTEEAVTGSGAATTTFSYDHAHNRDSMGKGGTSTSYSYNSRNQLTSLTSGTNTVSFGYDDNGNRATRTEGAATDTYDWDYENRLSALNKQSAGGTGIYGWGYDYRTRRVELVHAGDVTKAVFSGGTSVREFENTVATVDYVRGSDWGGGVGGILYSTRAGVPSFTHYNRRGDVTAKTDGTGTVTYQATYEAYGKRATETGATLDRQKSNTKDEDIPGYANEGFRFRDLETGIFLSKDPAGFIDGPNLYAYVQQNPWTNFDPDGLKTQKKHFKDKRSNNAKINSDKKLLGAENLGAKSKEKISDRIAGLEQDNARIDKAINNITKSALALQREGRDVAASTLDDETPEFSRGMNAHYAGEAMDAWNSVSSSFLQMLPGANASNQAWSAGQSGDYAGAAVYGVASILEAGITVSPLAASSMVMQGGEMSATIAVTSAKEAAKIQFRSETVGLETKIIRSGRDQTGRIIGMGTKGRGGPTYRPKLDGSYSVGTKGNVNHYRPSSGGGHTVNQQ